MKKRFQLKKKAISTRPDCDHRYTLEVNKYSHEHKLVCRKCGRFYGYVKNDKDLSVYKTALKSEGEIDMAMMKWTVTDYTNKSDNFKRKKEPVYNPIADDPKCEACGKKFVGTRCPACGSTRTVRRVRVIKRGRRK